jgi:hypothetical protein
MISGFSERDGHESDLKLFPGTNGTMTFIHQPSGRQKIKFNETDKG